VHQPEIYTKFVEILQTYQLESKRIQDVHTQVTQLFWNAPELLEEFMQFLSQRVEKALRMVWAG
jgi:paired amphipathic helix protein Sin3a